MRELALLMFQTLDGVMQAPKVPDEDPTGGFVGGWADPYWDPVMEQVRRTAMAAPYDMLLGRSTYDSFAASHGAREAAESEAGAPGPMTSMTKYVATSQPESLAWANSVALTGDLRAAVAGIKAESGPLIQVHGSWQLVQSLLAERLVDEIRLWTFPVVVGDGKRLFGAHLSRCAFELVASEPTGNGCTMGVYRVTG